MLMMKERRPYPASVGALVSAKRGHNPRMRGARLDVGPRWPACPGARPSRRPVITPDQTTFADSPEAIEREIKVHRQSVNPFQTDACALVGYVTNPT
jgi:hypothetical protein